MLENANVPLDSNLFGTGVGQSVHISWCPLEIETVLFTGFLSAACCPTFPPRRCFDTNVHVSVGSMFVSPQGIIPGTVCNDDVSLWW